MILHAGDRKNKRAKGKEKSSLHVVICIDSMGSKSKMKKGKLRNRNKSDMSSPKRIKQVIVYVCMYVCMCVCVSRHECTILH